MLDFQETVNEPKNDIKKKKNKGSLEEAFLFISLIFLHLVTGFPFITFLLVS